MKVKLYSKRNRAEWRRLASLHKDHFKKFLALTGDNSAEKEAYICIMKNIKMKLDTLRKKDSIFEKRFKKKKKKKGTRRPTQNDEKTWRSNVKEFISLFKNVTTYEAYLQVFNSLDAKMRLWIKNINKRSIDVSKEDRPKHMKDMRFEFLAGLKFKNEEGEEKEKVVFLENVVNGENVDQEKWTVSMQNWLKNRRRRFRNKEKPFILEEHVYRLAIIGFFGIGFERKCQEQIDLLLSTEKRKIVSINPSSMRKKQKVHS